PTYQESPMWKRRRWEVINPIEPKAASAAESRLPRRRKLETTAKRHRPGDPLQRNGPVAPPTAARRTRTKNAPKRSRLRRLAFSGSIPITASSRSKRKTANQRNAEYNTLVMPRRQSPTPEKLDMKRFVSGGSPVSRRGPCRIRGSKPAKRTKGPMTAAKVKTAAAVV